VTRVVVLVALVAALVLSPAALAHVVPQPSFVQAGTTADVSLRSPNERDKPMTALVVKAPDGLEIVHAHGPDGWSETVQGSTATWSGGSLAPGTQATFGLQLRAGGSPGNATLSVEQRYGDGVVRWPVLLTITPPADTPSENFALAGVVGVIGLLVVAIIGVLAWRRRTSHAGSLQEK
jgi:uncharacterized protein YcnI